jgi:hypothetical protein
MWRIDTSLHAGVSIVGETMLALGFLLPETGRKGKPVA